MKKLFFILLIGSIVVGLSGCKMKQSIDTGKQEASKESRLTNIPTLDLPLRYFTNESVAWGSVNPARNTDDKNTWEFASVDGGDAYQSAPTTTITLSSEDYSQKRERLPSIKTLKKIISEAPDYESVYRDQLRDYGNIATRFLPTDSISGLRKFDVDNDGKDETILSLCGVGGNHCPHYIIVVRGQNIIFSSYAGLYNKDLAKTDTANGFYLHWTSTEGNWDDGACCTLGYKKTRFVYEDNKFIPVYEQEVKYFKVKNSE